MPIVLVPVGLACMAAALYHGYLGQTRLIDPATFPSRQAKEMVGMIWQFSTAAWAVCGAIIALSPWLFPSRFRLESVICACLPIGWGILGNAWITRGRHFGWKIFAGIVAAAIVGAAW
jgi:hypothetical protein